MTLLAAWVAFPLLLATLGLAIGRLVESLSGLRLPRTLLAPVGLATAIVLGQPATLSDATAELAVPAILAAAAAGLVLSLPWRRPGLDAWALGAAVTVFAAYAAPVVLSGEPAFGGYIELDDTASWLALTERALEQGANTAGLAPSTYEATLDFYLGSSYPLGAFIPLGAGQLLLGLDAAWLYQPYIALLAAMLALSLYSLARPVIASRPCAPSPPSWRARRRSCSPTRCGEARRRSRRRGCSPWPARSSRSPSDASAACARWSRSPWSARLRWPS
jgi:hypothetical protein